jgi:hypothetical protein
MPMTDTDHLSTPTDMVKLLKLLPTIMRDVEALPEGAQQRFWEDVDSSLQAIPVEDLRLNDAVSLRSVRVIYSILSTICGPRLAELVNGEAKEYYERLLTQMQEMTQRPPWEVFLDQKFDETKGTTHEGSLAVTMVVLASIKNIGSGVLRRVGCDSKLLTLSIATVVNGSEVTKERYFTTRDIIMMELAQSPNRETIAGDA